MDITFLERWQPQLLSVLRIMSGLLFLEHGAVKLLHFPVAMTLPPNAPAFMATIITIAGVIELVGGAVLTVGVFTRLAAFIMSGEMAVAYFMVHMKQGGFWPAMNGGEGAILFCFIFLYIAAAGPGPWAVSRR